MVVVIRTSQKYGNVFELCRFIIRLRCSLACMCFSRFCSKKGTLLLICLSSHSHPQLAHSDCHHYSCIQMSFVKSKRYATGNKSSLSVASICVHDWTRRCTRGYLTRPILPCHLTRSILFPLPSCSWAVHSKESRNTDRVWWFPPPSAPSY